MSECIKFIVKGRVQGVSYRAFVRKHAMRLGVTGYAKNLQSGDVEVVICGEKQMIKQLLSLCRKGPLLAKVTSLDISHENSQPQYSSFLRL